MGLRFVDGVSSGFHLAALGQFEHGLEVFAGVDEMSGGYTKAKSDGCV